MNCLVSPSLRHAVLVSTLWSCVLGAVFEPPAATVPPATVLLQQDTAMGFSEILEGLGHTYASMSVYSDRGTVTTTYPGETRREPTQTFTTQFERSKRFTWTSDLGRHGEYGVVVDGTRVAHIWNRQRETMNSVDDAVSRSAGVSQLSSVWVPALLMPDAIPDSGLRGRFSRATSASRLPDETLNGRQCFVIASSLDGSDVRVWISKRDFLIRRIEQRYARYNSITTTDYAPQTDISLSP